MWKKNPSCKSHSVDQYLIATFMRPAKGMILRGKRSNFKAEVEQLGEIY